MGRAGHAGGHRGRRAVQRRRRFAYPVGVRMVEGENYRQREGYEVAYRHDDEPARYQYTIAVGTDRAAAVFLRLAEILPRSVCAVLEIPGPAEEAGRDLCEVWIGRPRPKAHFLRAFKARRRLFVHDGMVGFGCLSPDGGFEVFLDEHKLLCFYAPNMDRADEVMEEFGLPYVRTVRHFSELAHVHVSLAKKGAGEDWWEAAEKLKGRLGLEWEETKEYS